MDFNTLLAGFGFDSSNFVNKIINTIEYNDGIIYEVEERYSKNICPNCNHGYLIVHTHKWINIKLSSTLKFKECLRIRRIRYKCPKCNKTITFSLKGIEKNKSISNFVTTAIRNEFYSIQSFSTIAKRYELSTQTILNIFDDYKKIMPRRPFPRYLCIDEKHFEGDTNGKYCVVLSDFFSGEVIDVLENRQMPYLDEYLKKIPLKERNNVIVFISDMYDAYSTIKNKYFPQAIFVVDLFHVIKLLTTTLNKIRIRTYNQYAIEGSIEKHFMKTNWKLFLIDLFKIQKSSFAK